MSKWRLLLVIFALTFSTILIEVLYTRIFSAIYFGEFGFLMISLALFGYGISGIYVSLKKFALQHDAAKRFLPGFLLIYLLLIPVSYKLVLVLGVDFLNLFKQPLNLLLFFLNCLILLIPFFLGGTILSLVFSVYSREIGQIYFVDLLGAAIGAIAVIPLIPYLGPTKILLLTVLMLFISWFFFIDWPKLKKTLSALVFALFFVLLFAWESKIFEIIPKLVEAKRFYDIQRKNKRVEYSRWSPINKIDVAPWPWLPPRKVIWINNGKMQSFVWQFDGDLNKLKPIRWDPVAIVYQLTKPGAALIIGSAGGYEVLCALSNRFQKIVAVEMDPVICDLLKKEYAGYTGMLFHRPEVQLLADEGRSVVKRSRLKYDVIQMVNSHNTDSLLSGALSVAETYIYTVDAFKDYWEKLKGSGVLYIVHWNGERMFTTALQALKEMGVAEPEKKFFIVQKPKGFNYFFLKKGNFEAQELEILKAWSNNKDIFYSPDRNLDNIYYQILQDFDGVIKRSAVNIRPVYDYSPYFNQPNRIGQFSYANIYVQGMIEEILQPALIYSNSIYLAIFLLSLLFSFFFIYLPLKIKARGEKSRLLILYFFLIGLAYIMAEIIFIKIFQLYLGSPAVSISLIIFSLLIASGFGSLFSEKLQRIFKRNFILYFAVFLFLVFFIYAFGLFPLLNKFIYLATFWRYILSFVLIAIPGFAMGFFFPTAIRELGSSNQNMIGWGWGANAFATGLGSISAVIIAINWNFILILIIAALCYLISGIIERFLVKI